MGDIQAFEPLRTLETEIQLLLRIDELYRDEELLLHALPESIEELCLHIPFRNSYQGKFAHWLSSGMSAYQT